MRLGLVVLVMLLAPSLATDATVRADASADAFMVTPASGDMATVFTFESSRLVEHGENVLVNPAFADGVDGWTLRNDEILGSGSFEHTRDGVRFSVPAAQAPGSAFAKQRVPLSGGAFTFAVDARGTGSFPGFEFIIRESGYPRDARPEPFLDSTFRVGASSEFTTHRWEWHPRDARSTHAEVFLRAVFRGGDSGDVTFRSAALTPFTAHRWDFGDGAPPAHGATVEHRFHGAGTFNVTLTTRAPGAAPERVVQPVTVTNRAPAAAFSVTRVGASGLFEADARTSVDPDGAEARVRNAAFGDALDGWRFENAEVGGRASADVAEGAAVLRVTDAARGGSVYLAQDVPAPADRPYRFTVRAMDAGDVTEYAFIVREHGSASGQFDHVRVHEPVGDAAWRTLGFTFTPRYADSTHFTVHLRALVPEGADAVVRFDDARLEDVLRYAWFLDGERLAGESGERARFHPGPGVHNLTLRVTDAGRAVSERTVTFDATPPAGSAPQPGIVPPPFALVKEPAVFSAAESRPSAALDALENRDFANGTTGWRLRGPASATFVPTDAGARVTLPAGATRPVDLAQDVRVDAGGPYEVHVRYRNVTPVARVEVVIEEYALDADGLLRPGSLEQTVLRVPSSDDWRAHRVRWSPVDPASTHARVLLRAWAAPDAPAGVVEYAAASFAPAKLYEWSHASAAPRVGHTVQFNFTRPGLELVTLTVTDASGAQNATSVRVAVLDPDHVRVAPALGGGVTTNWSVTLHPAFAGLELVRSTDGGTDRVFELPVAAAGAFTDPAPPRDVDVTYAFHVVLDNGSRALVNATTLRVAPDAPVGRVDVPESAPRLARVAVTAIAPPDAVRVTGVVAWGPFTLADLAFERDARVPDAWRAHYRPGHFTVIPLDLTVTVTAEDAHGTRTRLGTPATLGVSLFGHGAWDVVLLLGAVAFPAAAFGVRAYRVRRRSDA